MNVVKQKRQQGIQHVIHHTHLDSNRMKPVEFRRRLSATGLTVLALGGRSGLLNLTLDTLYCQLRILDIHETHTKRLGRSRKVDELSLDKGRQVLEGLGLLVSVA